MCLKAACYFATVLFPNITVIYRTDIVVIQAGWQTQTNHIRAESSPNVRVHEIVISLVPFASLWIARVEGVEPLRFKRSTSASILDESSNREWSECEAGGKRTLKG